MAKAGMEVAADAYEQATAIVTADTGAQAISFDAFMVGVAGNVAVIDMNGVTTTLKGLLAGVVYPIRVTQFKTTGTTATDLVGLRY